MRGNSVRVVVSGTRIERSSSPWTAEIVRVLTQPNSGIRWILPVNPRTMKFGVHRVLARTIFTKDSGTKSRTLRVVFSRCARRAVSPAFTG